VIAEEMKVRDIIKAIEKDSWYLVSIEGDHRQYRHPQKPGRVTVPGYPNKDVAIGTLISIYRQAQIRRRK
jgi:predicted RNA binding protein YcfA (HicA-like mRNA interferase family)